MPAYNFKRQFADAVESGAKRQTIRPKRKRLTVPGDTLYLYTGMRTKACRKLKEAECLSVEPIEIIQGPTYHKCNIKVSGRILSRLEAHNFAVADGFQSRWHFYKFFRKQYVDLLEEQKFVLIKW